MKLRSLLVAATLLAAILTGRAAAQTPRTIVVFGDSITAGSALPASEKEQAWIRVVEKESQGKLKLINEGKGGRPTASVPEFDAMLKRIPQAPDLLVIALGTNDSRDITEGCIPKAVANVRAMIEHARSTWKKDLPVLLVGPPNINKEALGPTKPIANEREGKLKELGDAFAKLGQELKCEYFTLFGVIPGTSLTKDGVHPDPAGNAAIAKAIAPHLQPK